MADYHATVHWQRDGQSFVDNRYSRRHVGHFDGGASYRDDAVGVMARNADGKLAMTRVTLRPAVVFACAKRPDPAELARLHHEAHDACFIANSVRTEVRCEPVAGD